MSAERFLKTGIEHDQNPPTAEQGTRTPGPHIGYELLPEGQNLMDLLEESKRTVRGILYTAQEIAELIKEQPDLEWGMMQMYLHTLAVVATHQNRSDYAVGFARRRDRKRIEKARDTFLLQAHPDFLSKLERYLGIQSFHIEDWVQEDADDLAVDEPRLRFLCACIHELCGELDAYPRPASVASTQPTTTLQLMAQHRDLHVPLRNEAETPQSPPPPPNERYQGDYGE